MSQIPYAELVAAGQSALGYRLTSPSGDVLAFNRGSVDSNGVEFYASRLDGWDSPDVRTDEQPRVRDHGLLLGSFYYDGRPLTLTGWILSPNGIEPLRLARERLVAAVDNLDTYTVLNVDETIPKRALVRRAGKVGLKQTGKHLLEFDIALIAPDPRRYADQLQTYFIPANSSLDVATGGTFRAGTPPVITLIPSGNSVVTLTESTSGLNLSTLLGTGGVVVDTAAGTVKDGSGALAFGRMSSSFTFPIIPSGQALRFTVTGGSATLVFRDAWS